MPIVLLFLVTMIALKFGAIFIVSKGGHIAALGTLTLLLYVAHRVTAATPAQPAEPESADD